MTNLKIADFYDEFRPYNEKEARDAFNRIFSSPHFFRILQYFYPDNAEKELQYLQKSIQTIEDFQKKCMYRLIDEIIKHSTNGFSYSGLEHLNKNESYIFIANHRDIVLDAALLQYLLVKEGFPTTEITFGNNLMNDPLMYDIGKVNRMFKVYRKGTPKELLKKTLQLSEYIRYTVQQKNNSVWIAQRGGRTKDGKDRTQSGIIKMLNASGTDDMKTNLQTLHIIPLSISYEFEPNDHLKVKELMERKKGDYQKAPGEDISSIKDGITSPKGKVHLSFSPSITDRLESIDTINRLNEKINKVTQIIDSQIFSGYKIYPNNYIAQDLLSNSKLYLQKYSAEEKLFFENYMHSQLSKVSLQNHEDAKKLFLQIYAEPVKYAPSKP